MSLAIVLLHGEPAKNSLGLFLSLPLRIAWARIVNASPEDPGRKPQGDGCRHHLSVSLGLPISWHLSGCEWLPLQGKVNHVVSCCLHHPPLWSASVKQRKIVHSPAPTSADCSGQRAVSEPQPYEKVRAVRYLGSHLARKSPRGREATACFLSSHLSPWSLALLRVVILCCLDFLCV